MKNKIGSIIVCLISLIYIGLSSYTNILSDLGIEYGARLFTIIIIDIYLLMILFEGTSNAFGKDKLFDIIVNNTDTVYLIMNKETKKIIYLSDNAGSILGLSAKNMDKNAFEILNKKEIKQEISNWDGKNEYVSQMIEYDNPKYHISSWLRVKIFNYKNKKDQYTILEIKDITKEKEKQHILISQATDIKYRENQLNQITAKSYDVELEINMNSNTFNLKYFKSDNKYFGEEKRGVYTQGLKDILTYINDDDKESVRKALSIEKLRSHFDKMELNSVSIRYRLGNEVKNNTWLESTIFFITSRQGNKVSVLTKNVTEDAQNIREQNVLLQNALNEAKLADKSKTNLIRTISHDIRTPMTNIVGFSDSLLSTVKDKKILLDIENIKSSSNEILTIIDELLDTSKIEKKVIEKEEKNYNLLKMFKEIEDTSKEYIKGKSIKLNMNLDKNLPVILYGDERRIKDAVLKILYNSIKYTSEGMININVSGNKKDNIETIRVVIRDTGNGINSKELNEIMKKETGGIGSVKKLMDALSGKLELESKEGEYTKVTLTFDQKIVEDNKIRELLNKNKDVEEFDLTGKRVLVVDDNRLNLKVTNRLLKPYNVLTILVESGEECLSILKESKFDLILLDQMMPGMNGVEVMKKLKEDKNFNTPIVVLTADAVKGQKEKYLSEGYDDYMSKPIDRQELSRVLKKFLKNH